ncbi:MAG: alpha/beta hydrolase [Saprospiraceae bacterium]|nr:alpha/beta hydrolase [Candidatus Vicinibacter proximus]MCC6843682.1 alpha/beta hydrolase [Saprospiraceae bacterium]HRG68255.1 alpha/beta hydrolase [Saprospiraceae bacterium]
MESATKGFNLNISVNDFLFSYDDFGEGNIPIIFLHGFPFDKTMWRFQLDFFKNTHRIIALDIRGFGKSIDETSALSIDLFSEDLILLMDQLSIKKAIVCGLSMGGYIALNAIKRFPDRFEALVLCDTQCNADSPEVKKKRYNTIDDINMSGTITFSDNFIKNVFYKDSLENQKELVQQLKSVVLANSKYIITQGLTALAERTETCSTLNNITIPTLIICGREDTVTPLTQSEFMHAAIRGSKLQVIDRAGHVSNLEQPLEFNRHLFSFLTDIGLGNGEEEKGI